MAKMADEREGISPHFRYNSMYDGTWLVQLQLVIVTLLLTGSSGTAERLVFQDTGFQAVASHVGVYAVLATKTRSWRHPSPC